MQSCITGRKSQPQPQLADVLCLQAGVQFDFSSIYSTWCLTLYLTPDQNLFKYLFLFNFCVSLEWIWVCLWDRAGQRRWISVVCVWKWVWSQNLCNPDPGSLQGPGCSGGSLGRSGSQDLSHPTKQGAWQAEEQPGTAPAPGIDTSLETGTSQGCALRL